MGRNFNPARDVWFAVDGIEVSRALLGRQVHRHLVLHV